MSEFFEDEWKQFQFKLITISDLPIVQENLRNNGYLDEPLNQLLGLPEDRLKDLDRKIAECVQEGLCFFVLEKESQKVAGVQIMYRRTQGSYASSVPCSSTTESVSKICSQSIYKNLSIFDEFGVLEYVHIGYVSVSREFRGLGLSNEMCKQSVRLCKAKKFSLIESIFTNPFSRKAALKCGFQEICRAYFLDMKNEHPNIMFNKVPDKEDFASVMIIRI